MATSITIASRPCVVCGSSGQKLYGKLKRGQYLRCSRCGLICQDGSVPYEETQAGYEQPKPEWDVGRFEQLPHRHQQAPPAILATVREHKPAPCPLLDVGCFRGFTLKYFQSNGWCDLHGIEPSQVGAAFARDRLGLDVEQGYLEDYIVDPAHRRFGVVLAIEVIEHTPDPARFLSAVREVIEPDGILLLEVPCFSGPNVWAKAAASRLGLGHPPWRFLGFPKHVFNFTPRSMQMLLERSGFTLLEWSVRSKVRENDGPALRLVRRIKSRLHWGSTMQFVARPGR